MSILTIISVVVFCWLAFGFAIVFREILKQLKKQSDNTKSRD